MEQTVIISQLKTLLEQNNNTISQQTALEKIDAPETEILSTLHKLMDKGKISYDINYDINGFGKEYTEGLVES